MKNLYFFIVDFSQKAKTLAYENTRRNCYITKIIHQLLMVLSVLSHIERDAYGECEYRWNAVLLATIKQYSFKPKDCRPYRTKTKGKVERFNNSYLKSRFVISPAATMKQAD